jgi:GT2 family glycosyltransferase
MAAGERPLPAGAVTAVVVSYSDTAATRRAIESLLAQSSPPLEVLVADNHPDARLSAALAAQPPQDTVRVVHSGANLGYTGACNLAASQARGEWCFFLNPDAIADPGCLAELLAATDAGTAIVGAQVLLPDGRVNAGDNPLHLTGISWAGRYGQVPETGPVRDVAAVSGAALLARTSTFAQLGGLCARFFLYQDDADLCWRARLSGWDVRFCPAAVVVHDYEFDKGAQKWFWLERNRLWSVLANYSWPALVLLAPLLLGTELAIAALAVRDGWTGELLRAWAAVARSARELARWRRGVQALRRRPDSEVVALMATEFDTPLLDSPAARRAAPLLRAYGAVVHRLLGLTAG